MSMCSERRRLTRRRRKIRVVVVVEGGGVGIGETTCRLTEVVESWRWLWWVGGGGGERGGEGRWAEDGLRPKL
ncbi:hypothetical protein TIFTF001_045074 [Ficus carica]|uniref:Uncharacterized protein n=2 Tax=Ficus carica TaxID=3494 RepID=A0AA87YQ12_FICCA|nr:hypothetical protein TIFTF001_045074 [Ficus carica]